MFDLPLRALNNRQQHFADKSRSWTHLASLFLPIFAFSKNGSNITLIITVDATSSGLESKHGLDDGWNEWKHSRYPTAESLFCWSSSPPTWCESWVPRSPVFGGNNHYKITFSWAVTTVYQNRVSAHIETLLQHIVKHVYYLNHYLNTKKDIDC